MKCVRCRKGRFVRILPLPLTGEAVPLCVRCVGPAFLAHMHSLVVAHG